MIINIGNFKDFTDGTIKSVYSIDNKIIEMSLLFNKHDKDVICVPTHHFCNLGCKMCHLTNNKLNKKMVPINTNDFIKCLISTLTENGIRITNKKKLLISFMGVGDPLLNLQLIKEVYKCEDIIKDLGYDDIGYAIATMMPNTNIFKLKNMVCELDIPLKVHFSLHTPIDSNRYDLIPSTKVSVTEALAYLYNYRKTIQYNKRIMDKYTKLHSTDDPTEIHYTLIKGVNDSKKELNRLCDLLSIYKIPIKFIRFNPINNLEISNNEDIWINTIKKRIPDLRVKQYCPPGREVGSSCGEFTKHYYHEEIETKEELKEFKNWHDKHLIKKRRNDYEQRI